MPIAIWKRARQRAQPFSRSSGSPVRAIADGTAQLTSFPARLAWGTFVSRSENAQPDQAFCVGGLPRHPWNGRHC